MIFLFLLKTNITFFLGFFIIFMRITGYDANIQDFFHDLKVINAMYSFHARNINFYQDVCSIYKRYFFIESLDLCRISFRFNQIHISSRKI